MYGVKDPLGIANVADDDATGGGVVVILDTLPLGNFAEVFGDAVSYGEPIFLETMPWLTFPGRWGERNGAFGFDAPFGPSHQGRKWNEPVTWAGGLRGDTARECAR